VSAAREQFNRDTTMSWNQTYALKKFQRMLHVTRTQRTTMKYSMTATTIGRSQLSVTIRLVRGVPGSASRRTTSFCAVRALAFLCFLRRTAGALNCPTCRTDITMILRL